MASWLKLMFIWASHANTVRFHAVHPEKMYLFKAFNNLTLGLIWNLCLYICLFLFGGLLDKKSHFTACEPFLNWNGFLSITHARDIWTDLRSKVDSSSQTRTYVSRASCAIPSTTLRRIAKPKKTATTWFPESFGPGQLTWRRCRVFQHESELIYRAPHKVFS